MRRFVIYSILAAAACSSTASHAQQLFVYPQKGQSQEKQDIDAAECTRWAKAQSGEDPSAPAAQPNTGKRLGGTVGRAARGAALGAAVGAIAGDAGKGAAIGGVLGGVRGRRGAIAGEQQQQAQKRNNYDRAFAACMEARGYTVK